MLVTFDSILYMVDTFTPSDTSLLRLKKSTFVSPFTAASNSRLIERMQTETSKRHCVPSVHPSLIHIIIVFSSACTSLYAYIWPISKISYSS